MYTAAAARMRALHRRRTPCTGPKKLSSIPGPYTYSGGSAHASGCERCREGDRSADEEPAGRGTPCAGGGHRVQPAAGAVQQAEGGGPGRRVCVCVWRGGNGGAESRGRGGAGGGPAMAMTRGGAGRGGGVAWRGGAGTSHGHDSERPGRDGSDVALGEPVAAGGTRAHKEYTHTHARTHTRTHTRTHAHTQTQTRTSTDTHTHTYTYTAVEDISLGQART